MYLGSLATLLALPALAWGHTRSVSYASWVIDDAAPRVQVQVSLLDRSALEGAAQAQGSAVDLEAAFTRGVTLSSTSGRCAPQSGTFRTMRAAVGKARYTWAVRCPGEESPVAVRSDLLFDVLPAHVHLTSVSQGLEAPREFVLTEDARSARLHADASIDAEHDAPRGAWAFIGLGVSHILTGWDHLVFLLGLIVVARSPRDVAVVVTGFTLGHAVAIVAAASSMVAVSVGSVEALIGLSIIVIAAENVWLCEEPGLKLRGALDTMALPAAVVALALAAACAVFIARGEVMSALLGAALCVGCYFGLVARSERPERLRWAVVALFGVVHGFGFAQALSPLMSPEIGAAQRVVPLFGFNLGVELGQVALCALVWPVLLFARRRWDLQIVQISSAISVCLGVYWFVGRLMGD